MRRFGIALGAIAVSAVAAGAQRATEIRLDLPAPLLMTAIARSTSIVAGVSSDRNLRLWDSRAGSVSHTIDIAGRDAALLAISSDGRLILLGDYAGRVTIWSTATGHVEWDFRVRRYLTAAAFSRDGRLLAIAPGSPVQLHDIGKRQLLHELATTAGTTSVVFSRDGASLASSDEDGVRIYDVRSGSLTAKNGDFVDVPLAVEFSGDGKYLLAAGGDRTVLLLDAATGKTLRRSAKVTDPVFYLETSPNGREVAVVTLNADDPQRPAPIVFADVSALTAKATWRPPAGALLPGATWASDGHFLVVTQTAGALHLWSIR